MKKVCRYCSYIEKEKISGNEITYTIAHLKQQPGGVLKFYARSLKNMFERVHFQVKQHARSLLTNNSYTNLFQEFCPNIQYLLLKFQNPKNTYISQITCQWLFLNQFIGILAIHRNHTDKIAIIVTNS